MAKRVIDLPTASSVGDSDVLHVVQGGIDKQAPVSDLGISELKKDVSNLVSIDDSTLVLTTPST